VTTSSDRAVIRPYALALTIFASWIVANPVLAQPVNGEVLYRRHCAVCHGVEGQGNGPAAAAMRKRPVDLTQLARRNSGIFPEARVRRIVDGRDVESHGTREMPVWGDVFKTTTDASAADVGIRLSAIVAHLRTLQQADAQ
jgi:mono/diheme cytochrome c family protein